MALMSVRFGTNDVKRASAFYDATFTALGLGDARVPMDRPMVVYRLPDGLHFMLAAPSNGQAATHGNGDTLGFAAPAPRRLIAGTPLASPMAAQAKAPLEFAKQLVGAMALTCATRRPQNLCLFAGINSSVWVKSRAIEALHAIIHRRD